MKDNTIGRRYSTCATNKLFKVQEVLEPLRSPPKQKTRTAKEVATEKKEKEVKKRKHKEAWVSQEEVRKQLAKDIAGIEDKQFRAKNISKNQHFLFHLIQSYYILFLLFWG